MADQELVPFDGYISEESDFYGSERMRARLASQSAGVSTLHLVREWLKDKVAHPVAKSDIPAHVPEVLFNRFEGHASARQLTETVDEFLKRLPPKTTLSTEAGPWIWITRPTIKGKNDQTDDHPSDSGDMLDRAQALLGQYSSEQDRIKSSYPNAAQSTITKKLSPLRDKLKEDILDLAVANNVTEGKWMLFPKPDDVNRFWRLVAEAVTEGRLGDTAKIATADPEARRENSRLICIYTKDFSDLANVRRVLMELVELGLAPRTTSDGAIYYKADVYTYLGIDASNQYGLKASLYSSKDLMGMSKMATVKETPSAGSTKRKQQTLTTMFGGEKKRKT